MKECTKCGLEKPLEEFYFRKDTQRYTTVCKECNKKKQKDYYVKHKEYYSDYNKKYRLENHDYFYNYMKNNYKKYYKKYYEKDKENRRSYQRGYYKTNKEKVKKYNKQYKENKKKNNDVYKISCYISKSLRDVFNIKGKCHFERLAGITGLDSESLYLYLLQTFKDNYNKEWDGVEKVHIDHIIPLATAKTIEDVIQLNKYSNLQLLTAKDNMKKWKHID